MRATQTRVEVVPSADALARTAAELLIAAAAAAIATSGRFTVALAGGSTPKSLYELLATDPYSARVDWPRVEVFWSDERCVPPDGPESNWRMARATLLDHVPVPRENVHRIRGEDDPAGAATAYERELQRVFRSPAGPPAAAPRFDLVLLGMGENGHTASLFPRSSAVRESERWVLEQCVAELSSWRVTFTPVLINAAAEVLFLVSGGGKAATLRRVIEGPYQPSVLPAQIVAPRNGCLRWLVDAAAAAELHRGER